MWAHLVWSTKDRKPLLTHDIRKAVFHHMHEHAKQKGIHLDCVNGYHDHVHCLMLLQSTQTIAQNVQLIKGEASYWINKQQFCARKFDWQDEYYAVSVSESDVERVRKYIYTQEIHHQNNSFEKEFEAFMRLHNLARMDM